MGRSKTLEKDQPPMPRPTVASESRVDLVVVRERVTSLVGKSAEEMVKSAIRGACDGNYQVMKYLFEIAGLYPATTPGGNPEEDSLAAILLRHLGIPTDLSSADGSQPGGIPVTIRSSSPVVE